MNCPMCGNKSKVVDTRHAKEENEIFRRRICLDEKCNYKFHSIEFEVVDNEDFKDEWENASRGRK